MVAKRTPADFAEAEEFVESAEKPRRKSSVKALTGIPAWKRRNKEPKTRQIMLRASNSQLALLQSASDHEERSQQKILEELVWPALEEKYGISEREAPS